jgi:hypothetical protein
MLLPTNDNAPISRREVETVIDHLIMLLDGLDDDPDLEDDDDEPGGEDEPSLGASVGGRLQQQPVHSSPPEGSGHARPRVKAAPGVAGGT